MYKLCKWIYELGYRLGFEEGKRSVYAEIEQDKMWKKIMEDECKNQTTIQ